MGKLQRHCIQQRAAGNRITEVAASSGGDDDVGISSSSSKSRPLVTEIKSTTTVRKSTPSAKPLPEKSNEKTKAAAISGNHQEIRPEFKLFKVPATSESPHTLVAEIQVPGVRSRREMTLDVGEDRIVFEARKVGYLLDIFVPFSVDLEKDGYQARFHLEEQTLKVSLPLLPCGAS